MFEFDKFRMDDDVIVTLFKFCFHISNSIVPTNVILGTSAQLHEVHLLITVKVTLT